MQTFLLESIIHDTLPSASISRYYKYIPETEGNSVISQLYILYVNFFNSKRCMNVRGTILD